MKALIITILSFSLLSCSNHQIETDVNEADELSNRAVAPRNKSIDEVAGNDAIKQYMQQFDSRGQMRDESLPLSADESITSFTLPEDLSIHTVIAEPDVNQPVFLNFDHKGRMWVVQYTQYPYPEGLKVINIDNHNRLEFDKTVPPPSLSSKGSDSISMYEDTNGDGVYDQKTDVLVGLNITTAVTLGKGKIWVLTPPHLVAYNDKNGDGIPEGEPEVHLAGFGLQDTHAVANSLRWGPDGWLYGAQGSTTRSVVSSDNSKDVLMQGQGLWRYHPDRKIFEVYAEGGGNTFHVEIDSKGRFYSGTNEKIRGYYYKQGGYYRKNWGKHGPLSNPNSLGYISGMAFTGTPIRFTHAWIKYQGNALPERYKNKLFGLNPLLNYVQLSRFEKTPETFHVIDEEKVLSTQDNWFRPVDIKVGPDGAIYIADWHDSRLSHVDPRDNWSKSTGRVYKISNKEAKTQAPFNLATLKAQDLVNTLQHPNKWFRQQALRLIGDRQDKSMLVPLNTLYLSNKPQDSLEALWAIHLLNGFDDSFALRALEHADPYVRLWSVRLIGDQMQASEQLMLALTKLANTEQNLEVLGQIASSAKRIASQQSLDIIFALATNKHIKVDTETSLLVWWALEAKSILYGQEISSALDNKEYWHFDLVNQLLASNLMQRWAIEKSDKSYTLAEKMFAQAGDKDIKKRLYASLQLGLIGSDVNTLPSALLEKMKALQIEFGQSKYLLALKQGDEDALKTVLKLIDSNPQASAENLEYIKYIGTQNYSPEQAKLIIPVLSGVAANGNNALGLRLASLQALGQFNDEALGKRLVNLYPDRLRSDPQLRYQSLSLLISRKNWALLLIDKIALTREISKNDLSAEQVLSLSIYEDEQLAVQVKAIWPEIFENRDAQISSLERANRALASHNGSPARGKLVYQQSCSACHQIDNVNAGLGPSLQGYDLKDTQSLLINIVYPNADIREGYLQFLLTTKNGQRHLGIIEQENEQFVDIKPSGANPVRIARSNIASLSAQKQSLMPKGLLSQMTEQQIGDLFAYLAAQH
jgi:putative heme-binding domain-containing protein